MSTKAWGIVAFVLAIVIVVLAFILFATPASAPTIPAAQNSPNASRQGPPVSSNPAIATSTTPLGAQMVVTSPKATATVSHTFEIAGLAPNAWYFEAVFPIQVRDANDDLIGSSQGQAQGDWTQPGLVTFTSQMTVDASYEGPATLVLLKDNPSGLPQNMDEVTIPIVIQ